MNSGHGFYHLSSGYLGGPSGCLLQPIGDSINGSQGNLFMGGNEKRTMQELNDRLASYLEKVRSLEEANTQLEGCIQEWHQKRSHVRLIFCHLQIETGRVTNAGLVLQIDNAKMATEDFRLKYEAEKALRQNVQNDVENIRKELDNMTIIITDLEMEIEALREDHILKKKEHEMAHLIQPFFPTLAKET
uniref:IF rod domain-containing protein n=1 Tax=Laticauda laticaudata TaxID=8630 RepID=A0A8C5S6V6_LATLA